MKRDILIYCDDGVGEASERETFRSLKEIFSNTQYEVKKVNHPLVNQEIWEDTTALFVIPGGRSSPHYQLLEKGGNQKIIHYVRAGGKFLGICAGGYYGCAHTEFAKGHSKLELYQKGVLDFFPGLAEGPILKTEKFEYKKTKFNLVKIIFEQSQKTYEVLYYGGPCFVKADQYANVEILAKYVEQVDKVDKPAAIIQCQVGEGIAILTGVHIEFSHLSLTSEELDESVNFNKLRASEIERKHLFEEIIKRFQL